MKPFLGIDLTTDKKNTQANGAQLLVTQPSPAMVQLFEQAAKKANETSVRAKLPLPLRIMQSSCGYLAILLAISLLRGLSTVSLNQAYINAPWIFWLGGGCLLIWVILKIWSVQRENAVLKTEESTYALRNFEKVCETVYSEMSVPQDAWEMEILSFLYKTKNGKIKVCQRGMQIAPYLNLEYKIFSDAENLYIANLEGKFAIPLTSIKTIHTIKKHICITRWNKKIPFNEGVYKKYKLSSDNYGRVHCKEYHILEFIHDNIAWGIYIPCYELPFFEKQIKK